VNLLATYLYWRILTREYVDFRSPLADLLQSTKSLLGGDFTSKLVPMISNTLGLVSQLGCASNFDFLGINVNDLAGKIIGGVSGLL
jgi:hypothetical protein